MKGIDAKLCNWCNTGFNEKGRFTLRVIYGDKVYCSNYCKNEFVKKNEWYDANLYDAEPNPEMGNIIFGHSRGRYPMQRSLWNILFHPLIKVMDDFFYDDFENDVFKLERYYWGDCTCDAKDGEAHKKECKLCQPNFIFKKTGLEIQWYKYPFRDSYSSKKLTIKEIEELVADCVQSMKGGN